MQTVLRTLTQTVGLESVERQYRVHVPKQGAKNRPLLFFFHGHGMTALNFSQNPAFSQWADRGYVFAFLQGLPQGDPPKNGWRTLASGQSPYQELDEDFAMMALQAIQEEWGTDANQVYAGGFSQGTDMCWQLYVHQSITFKGFCTAGRGIEPAFVGLEPAVLRPWATTIGRQEPSWEGHKDPPNNDALGALETLDYVCGLHRRTTTATPQDGSPAGVPQYPKTGTRLVLFDYRTPDGTPSEAVVGGVVEKVTINAEHHWFNREAGDNFDMTSFCINFWRMKAGLPAPLE